MHIVDDLRLGQQDDEVLGDKADSFLLHLLGYPDTSVLGNTELATYHTHICTVEVTGSSHRIGIAGGNGDLWEIRGNLFGIGV